MIFTLNLSLVDENGSSEGNRVSADKQTQTLQPMMVILNKTETSMRPIAMCAYHCSHYKPLLITKQHNTTLTLPGN